jgi:hypothetical protein
MMAASTDTTVVMRDYAQVYHSSAQNLDYEYTERRMNFRLYHPLFIAKYIAQAKPEPATNIPLTENRD